MSYALGQQGFTVGDAVRRLEQHPYVVICHHSGERHSVANMRQAMAVAKAMASRMPGHPIHIHLPSGAPSFSRASLVASISKARGGYRVRFNQSLRGLGDTLTDWACDQAAHSQSWRERLNQGLDTGAQAALIGGLAAGLLGAMIKRPIFGAVVGGVTGWAAHAIWTAPLAPGG